MQRPDIIVVPDSGSNRDFPSVAAGYMAEMYNCPVVDFNTEPSRERERLFQGDHQTFGFVAPVRAESEVVRLTEIIKNRNRAAIVLETPIDIQCCYPMMSSVDQLLCSLEFGDELPLPDYQRFDSWMKIQENWVNGTWSYPIMTSLGCPFGCIYCAAKRRRQKVRSVGHCIHELASAKERWGIKKFVVVDDCFNADKKRAGSFSEQVGSLDMHWMAGNGLRADRFNEGLAESMSASGCRWVSFGVESIDEDVLANIEKGESFQQIDRAVTTAKKYFDYVGVFLILGLPGASYKIDKAGIEWARDKELGIHLSMYVPNDQGIQFNILFDNHENRDLPDTYNKDLMLELYNSV